MGLLHVRDTLATVNTSLLIFCPKMPIPLLYQKKSVKFTLKDTDVTSLGNSFQLPQSSYKAAQLTSPSFLLSSSNTLLFSQFLPSLLSSFLPQGICTLSLLSWKNVTAHILAHGHPKHHRPHRLPIYQRSLTTLQISGEPGKPALISTIIHPYSITCLPFPSLCLSELYC